jgi:O-antigen/teichoic acid export membrane protein
VLALLGAGHWALVAQVVMLNAANMVLVWVLSGWRPGAPSRHSGVRAMLRYGGSLTGFNALNYFTRNADNILIGRVIGADALGIYAKAYQLLLLPLQQLVTPLSAVVVPALSRLQGEPERYRNYYTKALLPLVVIAFPLVAFCSVAAHDVIRVALGEQWVGAARVFVLLAPAALIGSFNVATGWVYLSLGRTDRQLRWGLLASTLTVASFVVGLRWGIEGVAAGFSLVTVALRYPSVVYCFRGTPLRAADVTAVVWRPAVAAAVAAGATWCARGLFTAQPAAIALLAAATLYGVVYAGGWLALPGGARTIREMMMLVSELRATRKPAKTEVAAPAADPASAAVVSAADAAS